MPETCGEQHPTLDVVCEKPKPCFLVHLAQQGQIDWDAEPLPEKKSRRKVLDALPSKPPERRAGEVDPKNPYGSKSGQDEGEKRALDAAPEQFKEAALLSIQYLASIQPSMTTDDVWRDLWSNGIDTEHRSAIGSLMKRAAKQGLIESTGEIVKAKRDDQREHGLTVWRSLTFVAAEA